MKNLIIGFTLNVIVLSVSAQCPGVPLTLSSQAQVDNFSSSYPGCTTIPDGIDLKIMGNDIADLSPLAQLTETSAVIEIRNCPQLANLNGLHNIVRIGNDPLDGFILRDLPALNSLNALSSLQKVTGEFTIRTCNALPSLAGLNNMDSVAGSVIIRDNASLLNLSGLDALGYIGETLELVGNNILTDVSALSNVTTITGGPEGGIFIESNQSLTSLYGLGNANTTAGGDLYIALNGNLSLCSVPVICNYLTSPPPGTVITLNSNLTGCNTDQEILASCTFAGIDDALPGSNVNVYPNPSSDYISIVPGIQKTIIVYDLQGRQITSLEPENEKYSVTKLENGFYLLSIEDKAGTPVKFRLQVIH